jgi:hypothetical protein
VLTRVLLADFSQKKGKSTRSKRINGIEFKIHLLILFELYNYVLPTGAPLLLPDRQPGGILPG